MLGMNWSELTVIFVIALVLLGPKDLLKIVKEGSQKIRQVKRQLGELEQKTGLKDLLSDASWEDIESERIQKEKRAQELALLQLKTLGSVQQGDTAKGEDPT